MKYEYGVEYDTNGEKPDLPDDVWVYVMFDGNWSSGPDVVGIWIWDNSQKLRIADKRYETKEQPMKYEYGVEYETNGKKPDLPGDVRVHVMFDGGWEDWDYECNAVENWAWEHSRKFRIVDERYMTKEQNMNDWYKKGELPPVGDEVEYSPLQRDGKVFLEPGQWYSGEIIAYHDGFVWTSDNGLRMISNTKFRPLRTESDVLVEKAFNDIGRLSNDDDTYIIERLIAKGWRPVKQQTEDEFVDYGYGAFDSPEAARKAYRAGCRFIEKE